MDTVMKDIVNENKSCKKTNVTFRITGDNVIPEEITKDIGINPTRSFAKGEVYETKRAGLHTRPIGHWSISSETEVISANTELHAKYILEKIENKEERIKKYIEDSDIRTCMVFWWEAVDGHGGFTISSDTMMRLCKLCKEIDFHFIG